MIDCYPDYDKEDLKIKINWINPNPSKTILLSTLVSAKKSLKMADKYHKKYTMKSFPFFIKNQSLLVIKKKDSLNV